MKNNKLAIFSEVSQIVSALAVIISLIYVGAQVNQNTKATQATIRQSIADNDITYLMTSLDNGILAVASYKNENDIELTELEMSQLVSRQHVNFRVFENAFYQFEQELLEPETWTRYRFIIKNLLENDIAAKEMWMQKKASFTSSFQEEISFKIKNNESIIKDDKISADSLNVSN